MYTYVVTGKTSYSLHVMLTLSKNYYLALVVKNNYAESGCGKKYISLIVASYLCWLLQ